MRPLNYVLVTRQGRYSCVRVCLCVLGVLDCGPAVGDVQLEGGAGHLGPLPVRGDPRAAEGGGAVPHQGRAL